MNPVEGSTLAPLPRVAFSLTTYLPLELLSSPPDTAHTVCLVCSDGFCYLIRSSSPKHVHSPRLTRHPTHQTLKIIRVSTLANEPSQSTQGRVCMQMIALYLSEGGVLYCTERPG